MGPPGRLRPVPIVDRWRTRRCQALSGRPERLLAENGEFHGAYGWHDLEPLSGALP